MSSPAAPWPSAVQAAGGGVAVLAVLEPPAAFGEMAVVDGGPRVGMATAREPTELLRIARSTVLRLVATEPTVGDRADRLAGRNGPPR